MSKLRSKSGETLLETMVSLVIIVLAIGIIASTSIASAKLNKAAREAVKVNFSYTENDPRTVNVKFSASSNEAYDFTVSDVTVYEDNGYLFYKVN